MASQGFIECSFLLLTLQADHTKQARVSVCSLKCCLGKPERQPIYTEDKKRLAQIYNLKSQEVRGRGAKGTWVHILFNSLAARWTDWWQSTISKGHWERELVCKQDWLMQLWYCCTEKSLEVTVEDRNWCGMRGTWKEMWKCAVSEKCIYLFRLYYQIMQQY